MWKVEEELHKASVHLSLLLIHNRKKSIAPSDLGDQGLPVCTENKLFFVLLSALRQVAWMKQRLNVRNHVVLHYKYHHKIKFTL